MKLENVMQNGRFLLGLGILTIVGLIAARWLWWATPTAPQIVYLGWDQNDNVQLFLTQEASTTPQQLTNHVLPDAVFDFAAAPDAETIAYSIVGDAGGSSIWTVGINGRSAQKHLTCSNALCTSPVWHPTQNRLLFEKRDNEAAPPQLNWLDLATGTTAPLLEENGRPARAARFAPQTGWLSYASPQDEGVQLYQFDSGSNKLVNSVVGGPVAWHPAGTSLLVSDLSLVIEHGTEGDDHDEHTHQTSEAFHLYQVDLTSGERRQLTDAPHADDGVAAWSPDGGWIAFGRRVARTALGRQLWLMAADGTGLRPLTDEPLVNYGPPQWSPDGSILLFQRFQTDSASQRPAVYTLDLETGLLEEVVSPGMQPAWLGSS